MRNIYRSTSIHSFLVFFFKQKTAYEITVRLEFRRVLFRSKTNFEMRRGNEHGKIGFSARARECRGHVMLVSLRRFRSEERRVGKECRSRWWTYQLKIKLQFAI